MLQLVEWTKLKFRLHVKQNEIPYFREREVWWASLGMNVGHEQDGKNANFERPVLVVRKFGEHTLLVVLMTSQPKDVWYHHKVMYEEKEYAVILSQVRTISSKRLIRKVRTISVGDFESVKERLCHLIKNDLPPFKAGVSEPEGHSIRSY